MQTKFKLNRHGELRHSDEELNSIFELEETRFLVCCKGRFLGSDNNPEYYSKDQIITNFNSANLPDLDFYSSRIYLGKIHKEHFFLILNDIMTLTEGNIVRLDLRTIASDLTDLDSSILFYAQGLVNWHFNHQYCAKCGSETFIRQMGHSRQCVNEHCNREHFPRIEPAIITSIETKIDTVSHILLARQASWPEKRYSVIAGFTEHGETLESTVKREALEEVGLIVNNIRYVSSQPWPFPASLMIAFSCETKQTSIRLMDKELEQAHWFSAKSLTLAIEDGSILMPYSASVSWDLIDRWYKKETHTSLQSITIKS